MRRCSPTVSLVDRRGQEGEHQAVTNRRARIAALTDFRVYAGRAQHKPNQRNSIYLGIVLFLAALVSAGF
jgi:hypothetical protein